MYNDEVAVKIFKVIKAFIHDAEKLIEVLENKK